MDYKQISNINIENAIIRFRNFSGAESQYNRSGDRNFCVVIEDPEFATQLIEDGWNIKIRPPKEEGDAPFSYLPVEVKFGNIPPNITLVTGRNQVKLNEETISSLDFADIRNIDLIIRPYNWVVNGNSGIKAYVKTMYVTIEEDEFAHKYAD